MKLLLIHFSDIHFTDGENSIEEKEIQLITAIQNTTREVDEIFIVVSGDSAFSGKDSEYERANIFFKDVSSALEAYSSKKIRFIVIPGNHDCDFKKDTQARQNQLKIIHNFGDSVIDGSVIDQCTIVQEEYTKFRDALHDEASIIFSNNILTAYKFSVEDYSIVFYCYNTAYISEIEEKPGKLVFPVSILPEQIFLQDATLNISLFHHPLNWLSPSNRREFLTHIHKTTDFYLTGHEHEFSKSQIDDLEGNITYHIEGSVLQESKNPFESDFNLIEFDFKDQSFRTRKFSWKIDKYSSSEEEKKWLPWAPSTIDIKNKYTLQPAFESYLNDVGGAFTHPEKLEINLRDIFVYPRLRAILSSEDVDNPLPHVYEDSEALVSTVSTGSKILFLGDEKCGKSSLLRTSYRFLHQKGYLPVLIQGSSLASYKLEDIKKVVAKAASNQYSTKGRLDIEQESVDKIVILIDDIDEVRLSSKKSRSRLLQALSKYYKSIIFTANEYFLLEEIISDNSDQSILAEFKQYEVVEFNYAYRAKLIRRWYSMGREGLIDDQEIFGKCDYAIRGIELVLSGNKVPYFPIYLLILLQALETTAPHDLQVSSYGTYYQMLINKSMAQAIAKHADLVLYENYCGEFANYLFENKASSLPISKFITFHNAFVGKESYNIPLLSYDKALSVLREAAILDQKADSITFKYPYTYYYFEAKYLAEHLSQIETRDVVSKICARVYRTEFANIVMFLIHFTKDDLIFDELLRTARSVFKDSTPCRLENDTPQFNDLFSDLPNLYLKSESASKIREDEERKLGEIEEKTGRSKPELTPDTWDLHDDVTEIDFHSKLNLTFKITELLGEILKNNYGALKGSLKHEMLNETYLMGLRALRMIFSHLKDNEEFFINQLRQVLEKYEIKDVEKIEKTARRLLFAIGSQISHMFIKKISDSAGTSDLMPQYIEVEEKFNFASVKLINFAIKLDHQKGFPDDDLPIVKEVTEKYPLTYFTMRWMVVDHLQKNDVNYKDKQRICKFLGIPIESQLKLESGRVEDK